MSSVGSCVLFSTTLLKNGVNFSDGGFVSFCQNATKLDTTIFLDRHSLVYHPSKNKQIKGRWI
jgi:hypothetical protein